MPAPKSNNYSQNPMPQGGGSGQNLAPGAPTARPAGVPLGLPGVGGPAPRQAAPDPQWQPAAPGYLKVRFIHTVAAFVPVLLVGLVMGGVRPPVRLRPDGDGGRRALVPHAAGAGLPAPLDRAGALTR